MNNNDNTLCDELNKIVNEAISVSGDGSDVKACATALLNYGKNNSTRFDHMVNYIQNVVINLQIQQGNKLLLSMWYEK